MRCECVNLSPTSSNVGKRCSLEASDRRSNRNVCFRHKAAAEVRFIGSAKSGNGSSKDDNHRPSTTAANEVESKFSELQDAINDARKKAGLRVEISGIDASGTVTYQIFKPVKTGGVDLQKGS